MRGNGKHKADQRILNKMCCRTLVGLTCLLSGMYSRAQNISNRGTEFWVGYGHHQFMEDGSNTMNMVLYLSAEDQPATVTVTIDSSGPFVATWWRKTYTI